MSAQPTLLDAEVIEAEIVEPSQNFALTEMRDQMLAVPVEKLQKGLAQYDDWRKTFREWLLSHMTPGVHFGVPPGCEAKRDERGWIGIWNKNADNGKGGKGAYVFYPPEQWQAKPSLYKAGANLIIDLMQLVDVYESDEVAWKMMGSPQGTVVRSCRLYPKGKPQTPETLRGHGTGARVVGQKGGDANNCIKMADKNALVAAVINGFALSDLFTQDIEDQKPPAHENPPAAETPTTQPRGERVSKDELADLTEKFKSTRLARGLDHGREAFADWVFNLTGMVDSTIKFRGVNNAGVWTRENYRECCNAIAEESSEGVPF